MAFFFAAKPPPLCLPPLGKGDRAAVDRILSQTAHLRRSPSLSFIPLEPYPARSAHHLPHAGKALSVGIVFPHMHAFVLTMREKRCSRIVAFPIGEGGPRQRRSGTLVYRLLETISFALFHTARTLSGSLRSPPSPRGEGVVSRKAVSSFRSLPHWRRGTAQRRSGTFVYPRLETHFPTLFHTASTLSGSLRSPPSPRGEGFVRRYCFSTYACICSDNARKAMLSYRSLPHWGRGTASAVDRVLSYIVDLRRSPSLFFIPLFPSNLRPFGAPPSIGRREGVSTQAPSLGRGCRAQRGGVGFLFGAAKPLPEV